MFPSQVFAPLYGGLLQWDDKDPSSQKQIADQATAWDFSSNGLTLTLKLRGGTKFHKIGHTFQPKKGQAVLWNNLNPDRTPNAATLHSGEPVLAGHKVIITKWFRELGSGPMFYDD